MASRSRMTGEERKRSLLNASRYLFARNGFKGTSVREIARAAGVSEGLLYKHFANKEALYKELHDHAIKISNIRLKELKSLEPGSETLVIYIFLWVYIIMFPEVSGLEWHGQLVHRSFLEESSFARTHFKMLSNNWVPLLNSSLDASTKAGDIVDSPIPPANRVWFIHHVAMGCSLGHASGKSVIHYETSKEELAEHVVLFSLRGIGMTEQAIRRYFQPKKLRALVMQVLG
jgi:AcrR family transcriptional regulator